MKMRIVVSCALVLLCVLFVSGRVLASETEHSYVGGVCTQCGTVETSYFVLTEDTTADWSLSQDLYLDLNGYDISGTIDTNGYAVYGMDSTTAHYICMDMGYFSCTDENGEPIVPQRHVLTDEQMTGSVRRYMTIPTDQGYTFHRFYIGITHTSLKPNTTGLGFKALLCGDYMVMDQLNEDKAFGYTLRLDGGGTVDAFKSPDDLVSAVPISLRIDNWDVENYGETELYAAVWLCLQDGTRISSNGCAVTLRRQIETVNALYKSYEQSQLDAVRQLIDRNPAMHSWEVRNFYISGFGFADAPAVGTGYKFGTRLTPMNNTNYYFSGSTSGNYLATNTEAEAASEVYLERVSGGYAIYFMNGNTKTYINIAYRGSSSSSVRINLVTDSAPTIYQLNTEYKYIYTTLGTRNYYIGTYTGSNGTTYTTLSASNTSYISNTATIGVTQFPAWFFEPTYDEIGGNTGGSDDDDSGTTGEPCQSHTDNDNNGRCDQCNFDVTVIIDLYAINDLHGKLADTDSHPGVDELSTYLNNAKEDRDNVILLSSGDMWQGAAESNLTKGLIITDWMNEMGFASMTLGNHEYDWGEDAIELNEALAEFPLLAINIYDRETNKQVDYCQSSVVVDTGEVQIGIIGAIGDCYSSISSDCSAGVYFLTGTQLTNLVKAEATRLRSEGVDFIVYSLHDGSTSGFSYYDTSLSNGYVDLVFEGHSHQSYIKTDTYGVYHLQGGGDNEGISYAAVTYNTANGLSQVTTRQVITASTYASLPDDPIVEELLTKYDDQISIADKVLGYNPSKMYSTKILQTIAELYCQAGEEKWGDQYNIVLGGGYLNCRSPYNLEAGAVTYGMLMSLLPFDNRLVLCSISGQNLLSKFINTSNSNYYIAYSEYGQQIAASIDTSKTYYVIVDSYTAYYAPNKLTVVDFYDENVYARDLFAQYIEEGNLNQ